MPFCIEIKGSFNNNLISMLTASENVSLEKVACTEVQENETRNDCQENTCNYCLWNKRANKPCKLDKNLGYPIE